MIDGKAMARELEGELKARVEKLDERGITPSLAVVRVGEDPASKSYIRQKEKASARVGVLAETLVQPETMAEAELLALVQRLNDDPKYHGVLVQLPLPSQISEDNVIEAIHPDKDVDGFHPVNVGRLVAGKECFLPCTPHGVQVMLRRSGNDPGGKHVVIVGRSNIVGKPLANILMQKAEGANATVTVCHSRTRDLASHTLQADILVAALGRPNTITADMVKQGAVVIDVGINRVDDPEAKRGYRLVGDVDFDAVKEKAKAITPVPGGVGPMTVAMLMENTVTAAERFG